MTSFLIKKKLFSWQMPVATRAGFTLIELLTVMAVLGVLSTIAAINYENVVYRSHANRATDSLISDLQLARMTAMRAKRTVTVAFNVPSANQYTISYVGNGGTISEVHGINSSGDRLFFDDDPPGTSPDPEDSIAFNPMGFAQPGSGGLIGNIYLSDSKNGRIFRIATTPGGGIEKRTWSTADNDWDGTPLTYTSP